MKKEFSNTRRAIATTALLVAVVFVGEGVTAQTPRANFSGNWQLDQQRTELGNIPPSAAATSLKVDEGKDSIIIERMGSSYVRESLPMTGSPAEVSFSGGSKLASIEFTDGGTAMKESGTYNFDKTANPNAVYPAKSTEIWTLSDDNRTLQILRKVELANNDSYSIKTVYTKQD